MGLKVQLSKNWYVPLFWGIFSFSILLLLWSLFTYTGIIDDFFLPTPGKILYSFFLLLYDYSFLNDILISIMRILMGFTVSIIFAVPLGIALALNKRTFHILEPVIDFIRYTPMPAFIPLLILWFGIGELEKIIVIFSTVFFQLVLMVANSVKSIPQEVVDFATTLGAKKTKIVTKVIYQYAKPKIFEDLRVSMGWAWSGLMLAEIVGATSGIGFVIIQSQRLLKTEYVIAGIIMVGLLGLFTDLLFRKAHQRLFPWVDK